MPHRSPLQKLGQRWPGPPLALALSVLLTSTVTSLQAPGPRLELPGIELPGIELVAHTPFKVSFTSLTATTTTVTPQPFRTHDGQRRTELAVRFTHLQVRDLCFSLRKNHHGTTNTIRIQIPELHATDLTLGLDSLDGLGVLGQQLNLRHLPTIANTPLSQPREPGFLPLQVGNGLLNISGTFRWAITHGFHVQHLDLHTTPHEPECY